MYYPSQSSSFRYTLLIGAIIFQTAKPFDITFLMCFNTVSDSLNIKSYKPEVVKFPTFAFYFFEVCFVSFSNYPDPLAIKLSTYIQICPNNISLTVLKTTVVRKRVPQFLFSFDMISESIVPVVTRICEIIKRPM